MKKMQIIHYFVLFGILAAGVGTFMYVSPNTSLQLLVGIITSVSYVAWGLIHHSITGDLHQKVVVEYILIGAIAIVLLATMLKT